jgi:PAS domain S-box-containing protein
VHRRKDGTTFPVEVNSRRVRLDRDYRVGMVRNITARKQAEEALQASERRYRLLFNEMVVGFALIEPIYDENGKPCDFRYLEVNPAFETHSGLPRDRVFGKTIREVLPTLDPFWFETYGKVATTGESIHFEEYVPPVERWLELTAFRTHQGQVGVTFADITERKRAEEALRQSEERFRVALKNSPTAVFNQDRDLRYTWMYNPQLARPVSEQLGKTPGEIIDPEEAVRITEVRRRVLETGVGVRDEVQVTFGGRKHYFDTTIEPVLDPAGAVIGLTGASTDVTELWEASEALREAKKKLTEEKLYLEQEIDTELGFGEIIGQSKALQTVMENVGKVAGSDATVLLLGETGTGKELVARAIHRLSRRAGNSFIKMNCAAIPSGLLESELFGNEKGAFTGAVSRKIGRLELADKGTLFLDEIGEISLALQPKLLRVLQDQEFERLGGTQTLKVDFRLIAASNRDLADSVRENEFRSDLYYRLNVFPIRMPPLRERREDIPLLVEHFVRRLASRMNRSIASIPKKTMEALVQWHWPGNVRELENFIERSVILSQGSVLAAPINELMIIPEAGATDTLRAREREHILRVLRESRGQLSGPKGAAARLGLPRSTLQSKLKQFGIEHQHYRD